MVASGGTVGAELGCGISSGEETGVCVAGTLTEGNPGCLGCGDLPC